jgi:hypothetical protein
MIALKSFACLMLMTVPPLCAAQSSPCPASADVLATEAAIAESQVSNDLIGIERLLAPGYTFTIPDGKIVSREQFIDDMRKWWKPIAVENSEQQVRCTKSAAIVIGKALYRWKGKTEIEEAREQYTDTYLYENGRWRRASSHSSCLSGRCT